jgi:hypothetical protein
MDRPCHQKSSQAAREAGELTSDGGRRFETLRVADDQTVDFPGTGAVTGSPNRAHLDLSTSPDSLIPAVAPSKKAIPRTWDDQEQAQQKAKNEFFHTQDSL